VNNVLLVSTSLLTRQIGHSFLIIGGRGKTLSNVAEDDCGSGSGAGTFTGTAAALDAGLDAVFS